MAYNPVPRDPRILDEILANPETRAIYEATRLQINLAQELKRSRIAQNMTQDDVANVLHTKPTAISRLEKSHENVNHFPSLLTLVKYASALGCELTINLNPIKKRASKRT